MIHSPPPPPTPHSTGANHAFCDTAHGHLSDYSGLLKAMSSTMLLMKLTTIMMAGDQDTRTHLTDVMRNKKLYIQGYGAHTFVSQRFSVYQMFNFGVRYFHAHVEMTYDTIRVTNTLVGGTFDMYVRELCHMMSLNPEEVVILHIERTLFTGDQSVFDAELRHEIYATAKKFNVSLYYRVDEPSALAETTYGELLDSGMRLIVVYPRVNKVLWVAEEALDYSAPYRTSLKRAAAAVHNRPSTGGRYIDVVKVAVTSNLTEHVDYFTGLAFLQLDTMYEIQEEMVDSLEDGASVLPYLVKGKADFKDMVLSVNNIDRELALLVIKANGEGFEKDL